jgi:hypothetical protein
MTSTVTVQEICHEEGHDLVPVITDSVSPLSPFYSTPLLVITFVYRLYEWNANACFLSIIWIFLREQFK